MSESINKFAVSLLFSPEIRNCHKGVISIKLYPRMVWFKKCKVLFCITFMKSNKKKYNPFQLASAIFMILALLWLTVSTPFVFASQQEQASQDKTANAGTPLNGNEEEAANPFGNTTEEKAPSSTTFSEEFLHDHHKAYYVFSTISQYQKCEDADTYVAYHGELLVPPPNAA